MGVSNTPTRELSVLAPLEPRTAYILWFGRPCSSGFILPTSKCGQELEDCDEDSASVYVFLPGECSSSRDSGFFLTFVASPDFVGVDDLCSAPHCHFQLLSSCTLDRQTSPRSRRWCPRLQSCACCPLRLLDPLCRSAGSIFTEFCSAFFQCSLACPWALPRAS